MASTNVQAFSGDVKISSNLAVNTNNLFVDTVSGNVGIGSTLPGFSLDVVGDVNYTGRILKNGAEVTSSPWNVETSPDALNYTAGNVGIGAANPQNKLVAVGGVTFGPGASTTNATYHAGMVNVIGGGTRALLRIENNSGIGSPGIIFGEGGTFTEDTVPTIKKFQGTNNLAIMTSGNVGIGTTNPHNYKLLTNGNIFGSTLSLGGFDNVYYSRKVTLVNNGDVSFQFYIRGTNAWTPGTIKITAALSNNNIGQDYGWHWTFYFTAGRFSNGYFFLPGMNLVNSNPGSNWFTSSIDRSTGLLTLTVLRNGRTYNISADCEITHYMGFYS